MKKLLRPAVASVVFIIMLFSCSMAFAEGSVSINCNSTYNVGDSFNVTVVFSGGNIGAVDATLTYSTTVLEFVSGGDGTNNSGGSVRMVRSQGGGTTMSFSMSFRVKAAGQAALSVSTADMIDYDTLETIGHPSGSKSITVLGAAASPSSSASPSKTPQPSKSTAPSKTPAKSASASKSATKSPSKSVAKSPSKSESASVSTSASQGVIVNVDGLSMTVRSDLSEIEFPEGFAQQTIQIEGRTVDCANNGNHTLLYLTDNASGESAFYLYSQGTFRRYIEVATDKSRYVFLSAPEDAVPENFSQTQIEFSGAAVEAWQFTGEDAGFYLVYAAPLAGGSASFYMFDSQEGTLQRYYERIIPSEVIVEVPTEVIVEVAVTPSPQPAKGLVERILDDSGIFWVVCALAGLALVLIVTVIIVSVNKKKKEAVWDDDFYSDDIYEPPTEVLPRQSGSYRAIGFQESGSRQEEVYNEDDTHGQYKEQSQGADGAAKTDEISDRLLSSQKVETVSGNTAEKRDRKRHKPAH